MPEIILKRGIKLGDRVTTAAFPDFTTSKLQYGDFIDAEGDALLRTGSTAYTGQTPHRFMPTEGYVNSKKISLDASSSKIIETKAGRRSTYGDHNARQGIELSYRELTRAELAELQFFFNCAVNKHGRQLIYYVNEYNNELRCRIMNDTFQYDIEASNVRYSATIILQLEHVDPEDTIWSGSQLDY